MLMLSCHQLGTLGIYERDIEVPGNSWYYNFHPSFSVTIADTSVRYNIYVILRHTNAYRYSNIWLLISSRGPGEAARTQRVELPLADREGNWLGTGMDDIFFHRIMIHQDFRFPRPGTYGYSLEQNMRQNPLSQVLSVGIRVERVSPQQP